MRVAAVLLAVVSVSGSSPTHWRTFRAGGISVPVPPGWTATSRPLTPVTWPHQMLAIASFRLPTDARGADGCEPKEALDRLPADGAFLFGWEYGRPSPFGPLRPSAFPPRPQRFRLAHLATYECMGRSYMLRFRSSGRLFQVHVVLGPQASPATRRLVLRVLDGFRATRP